MPVQLIFVRIRLGL